MEFNRLVHIILKEQSSDTLQNDIEIKDRDQKEWDDLKNFWKQKNIIIEPHIMFDGYVRPNSIFIPKEMRKQGLGTKVMHSMIDLADKQKRIMVLTPSRDFGATSVERLKKFYSKFGFVRNMGRNTDFRISQSMYRLPLRK